MFNICATSRQPRIFRLFVEELGLDLFSCVTFGRSELVFDQFWANPADFTHKNQCSHAMFLCVALLGGSSHVC